MRRHWIAFGSLEWATHTHRIALRSWYRYCRREMAMSRDEARSDAGRMFYGWARRRI